MLVDLLYKLSRKALPQSAYRALSRSPLGRKSLWAKLETYTAHCDFYSRSGFDLTGRTVAEVGCGNQYYTAFHFLRSGAERVLLIEPTFAPGGDKMAQELREYAKRHSWNARLEDIEGRIHLFRDLSEIPPAWNGKVEVSFSYLVLEHFHDLESFFAHTGRILAPAGKSGNLVDLSDHTYHLLANFGITRKYAVRRWLFHLRYSDRMFAFLNDPKCYMNRKLVPEYIRFSEKYHLKISRLDKQIEESAVIHPDLVRKYPDAAPVDLKTVNFVLNLEKAWPVPESVPKRTVAVPREIP